MLRLRFSILFEFLSLKNCQFVCSCLKVNLAYFHAYLFHFKIVCFFEIYVRLISIEEFP